MPQRTCSSLANTDWNLWVDEPNGPGRGITMTTDRIQAVLLWEILQELKRINSRLSCGETLSIPRLLRAINRKTPDPKRKK